MFIHNISLYQLEMSYSEYYSYYTDFYHSIFGFFSTSIQTMYNYNTRLYCPSYLKKIPTAFALCLH